MDNIRNYYLSKLGVTVWEKRGCIETQEATVIVESAAPEEMVVVSSDVPSYELTALKTCDICVLSHKRSSVIEGVGKPNANVMFILDAPTHHENLSGVILEDNASSMLQQMLDAINLEMRSVYLTHYVKCFGAHTEEEVIESEQACFGYLLQEIDLVKPDLVVILGRSSSQYLLENRVAFDSLRGKIHQKTRLKIPVLISYGLLHLLSFPSDRKKTWSDFKKIADFLYEKNNNPD